MLPSSAAIDESGSPTAIRKRKPEPVNLSLAQVEQELEQLFRYREDIEADETTTPEELAAIDNQIAEYCQREVAKVDGIAHAIRVYEMAAEFAAKEGRRNMKRSAALQGRADRLRDNSIRILEAVPGKRAESPLNVLRIQINGGKEPGPDIHDPELVPNEYCEYIITLPSKVYDSVVNALDELGMTKTIEQIHGAAKRHVITEKVQGALKVIETCPDCKGRGEKECYRDAGETCPRCDGTGEVRATVPGALFVHRGVHLRVGG